jgi:hypothetical protein
MSADRGCGAVATNSASNDDGSVGTDEFSFRVWLLEHSQLIVGGYLSALVLLAYPASLIVLWTQLAHTYGFGYWTALYAASLVPKTFVIGKVPLLIWTSLATSIAVWAWAEYGWGWKSTFHNLPGKPTMLRSTQLLVPFLLPQVVIFPAFPFSLFGLGVYLAYLSLCLVGAYIAAPLLTSITDDPATGRFYAGIVVVFIWALLAAVPLAGVEPPGLQMVKMGSGEDKREAALLSNSNGYWHVINLAKLSFPYRKTKRAPYR